MLRLACRICRCLSSAASTRLPRWPPLPPVSYDSLSLILSVSRRCQLVLLRKRMASATTFAEWVEAAFKYDTIQDKVAWTLRKDSTEYDADLIDRRLRGLKALRRGYDATDIAYVSRVRVHLPEVLYGWGC